MARIRNVRPNFWKNPKLEGCSRDAILLFIGMQNFCDDEGFHIVSFRLLKANVFPLIETKCGDIGDWIRELLRQSLLESWKIGEKLYWKISNWDQVIKKPTPSKLTGRRERLDGIPNSVSHSSAVNEFPMLYSAGVTEAPRVHDDSHSSTGGVRKEWSTSTPLVPHQYPTSTPPVPKLSLNPHRVLQFPAKSSVYKNSSSDYPKKLSTVTTIYPVDNSVDNPVNNCVDNSRKSIDFCRSTSLSNNISCCYNLNSLLVVNNNSVVNTRTCLYEREEVGVVEVVRDKGGVGEKGKGGEDEGEGEKTLFKNFSREQSLVQDRENLKNQKPNQGHVCDLHDKTYEESIVEDFKLNQYDSSGVDLKNGSTGKKIGSSKNKKFDPDDVEKIFDHWRETMGHPRAKMDGMRKSKIVGALLMGYSSNEICSAITGCSYTPHNMGYNDRGERYDGLHVILRNADQIDRFIRNCKIPPRPLNSANKRAISNSQAAEEWMEEEMARMHKEEQNAGK